MKSGQDRCQRCGKWRDELFVLDPELVPEYGDQGDFCEDCSDRYSRADWIAWFTARGAAPVTEGNTH